MLSPSWFTLLDNTKWFHNLASLLKAAVVIVDAITIQERPVLVHCSDGWDRTPQVIALAQLMLDPYYRTIEGFQVLIEREWLQFGHKFADRCRSGILNIDLNERCPVFLQWLDCVHQLIKQYPSEFEFNVNLLVCRIHVSKDRLAMTIMFPLQIKLVYHTYSCLFGSFTCNNVQERVVHQVYTKTISIWAYFSLERNSFINYLYIPKQEVLRPSCRIKDFIFWNEVYVSVCGGPQTSNSVASLVSFNTATSGAGGQHSVNTSAGGMFILSKSDLSLNEASLDESKLEILKHHHYQSQSKLGDSNKSASCENVHANVSGHSCSKTSIPHTLNDGIKLPFSPSLFLESPLTRALSDSCLMSIDDRVMVFTDSKLLELSNGTPHPDDSNQREQTFCNRTTPTPCASSTPLQPKCNGSSVPKMNGSFSGCVNSLLVANEICEGNNSKMQNKNNGEVDGLPFKGDSSITNDLFDLDGQVSVKDMSRLQLSQLIEYHKVFLILSHVFQANSFHFFPQRMISQLTQQMDKYEVHSKSREVNGGKNPVSSVKFNGDSVEVNSKKNVFFFLFKSFHPTGSSRQDW